MNKIDLKIFVLITLFSISGIDHSQVTKESISSRIHNMSKLLNDSSGARQVINGSNSEAKKKRQKALKLYQQANEKKDTCTDCKENYGSVVIYPGNQHGGKHHQTGQGYQKTNNPLDGSVAHDQTKVALTWKRFSTSGICALSGTNSRT